MDPSTVAAPKMEKDSMATSTISTLFHGYNDFMKKHGDPRSVEWPLMESLTPTILLTLAYVVLIKCVGPKFMKGKEAIRLTNITIAYNFIQAIFNAWLFYRASNFFSGRYSLYCQPVDRSNNITAVKDAEIVWWFYISKLVDFLDTVFLLLAKKDSSHLHWVHHASMPFSSWLGARFAPGGQTHFIVMVNSFIHVLMYTYYFLSCLGPNYRKFLWWKRYLTNMQMIQFVMVFIHNFQLYFRKCDYPMFLVNWFMFKSVLFFVLFANFYVQAYLLPRRKTKLESKQDGVARSSTRSTLSNGAAESHQTKRE